MNAQVIADLRANPKTWLITGVAGFIGSNLLEELLVNQRVIGIDNFALDFKKSGRSQSLCRPNSGQAFVWSMEML